MVISKLHLDKIEKNLSLIQGFFSELRQLSHMTEKDFLTDRRNPAAAESYLRRSLESVFDIGRHILAKSYGFKELEYKKIALELGERGIVEKDYAKLLLKMAGYRDRMVHLYEEVTPKEIYELLKNHLSDIERFISEISRFIDHYKKTIAQNQA
jgi:uncharacterized protein YutE (UPF0331/DUF86 family)